MVKAAFFEVNYMNADTIAAAATPMTSSGIGIIRISGDQALHIISKIFKPKKEKK